jgi:osmotically-inducible protein OsmY
LNRLVRRFSAIPLALGLAVIITGCAGNQYDRSTGETVDDTATTGRVKKALAGDNTYRYPDVKVTTFKGVVQLSGFVDNNDQKARAAELARSANGVKEVENRITLK